ncbi:CoA pyrophosphatase [Dyadobacter chenwenxiniae]|uniref:CoA pyrophosphatase n=1 Tax=Dyadobacter chenwenxiniae TaxID=2906456 RepID=A0A9X1PRE8_9BACT|nr:CoA pyrophosphatase [Dyadobacter chenwenxiniae]MCF0065074.1 CoA pyrophosphatase [Dyadobacter chenwenxiniae]UON83188.1 CoA pyrophosphatase [Dyadobacter chenwenxiniae]
MATLGSFSLFIDALTQKLKYPLPGESAHRIMQASTKLRLTFKPNARTRKSAVLVLFYPYKDEIYFPLILRPAYDGVHSGQVAFPGGRFEPTDENLIRTALREAQEEIGLRLNDVKILGILTELFIPASNFYVLPVIATMPYRPDFYPDPREVEDIFEIKLKEISDIEIIGSSDIQVRGEQVHAPHYTVQGYKIWGATAMMISELLTVLNAPDGDPGS